jgi:hypothetical protein
VGDSSPQLGGDLDLNSNNITGTGGLNITGDIALTGTVDGRDVAADGTKLDTFTVFGLSLVDDEDAATARGTLGLGTAATTASSDYATAAQGLLADSALQSVAFADLTATPTTLAGYGITDAATSAQGTLADTALQSNSTLNADNMTTGTLDGGTYGA